MVRTGKMAGIAALALLLSACEGRAPENAAEPAAVAPENQVAPSEAPMPAPVKIESETDTLNFGYAWPAQAAAIPALDAWLRENAAHQQARMAPMAQQGAEEARENGFPVRQYSFDQTWSVVANTPALLVLNAEGYEFTGGAHGMPFVSTLIWDKAKAARLPLSALLDVPALTRIAKARFCAGLDAERAKKRDTAQRAAARESAVPEFNSCVDMARQEIVPVSQGGAAIDTLRVEIMPYEAGPYVEGTYTIDLPMDAALMAAVKQDWKGAFAPR